MPIKAVVDSIDEIPEAHRELYTEKNGKFELTGIEGVKTQADIDRLKAAADNERNAHRTTKERYSVLADLDPAEVRKQLDRITELEAAAAGKLDDAGIQKLVDGRLSTVTAPLKRELDQSKLAIQERDQKIQGYEQKEVRRTINDDVLKACLKLKVQESAIEDALLLAERSFELSEDKKVITKDGIGVTPGVSAEVWLTDMQAKRPHWWGTSQGGGAGGSGAAPSGANPFSHEHWNMTAQGALHKQNPQKAEQMAKAAGTTIGGPRPAPRK
jgi:hypothetical protein